MAAAPSMWQGENLDEKLGRVSKKTKRAEKEAKKTARAHDSQAARQRAADEDEPTGVAARAARAKRSAARRRGDDSDEEDEASGSGSGGKKKKKGTSKWKYFLILALMCGGGLQVLVPIFGKFTSLFAAGAVRLNVNRPEDLQNLFFSGEPWFVLCIPDNLPVPDLATEAAALAGDYVPGFKVGVMDCWSPLPSSGQHVLKRFNLRTLQEQREEQERVKSGKTLKDTGNKEPPSWTAYPGGNSIGFTVANGERPLAVPMGWFTDAKTAAEKLVQYVKPTIEMKLKKVTSSSELERHCLLRKNGCLLVLNRGSKVSEAHQQVVHNIMYANRLLSYVAMDITRQEISIQSSLPAVNDNDDPRVVFFKKLNTSDTPAAADGDDTDASSSKKKKAQKNAKPVISVGAKAHHGDFYASTIKTWLNDEAVNQLVPLKRLPTLRKAGSGASASKKPAATSSSSTDKPKKTEKPSKPTTTGSDKKPAKPTTTGSGSDATADAQRRQRAAAREEEERRRQATANERAEIYDDEEEEDEIVDLDDNDTDHNDGDDDIVDDDTI